MGKTKVLVLLCIIVAFAVVGFSISNWNDKTTVADYINNGGYVETQQPTNLTDVTPGWTSGTNMPAPTRYHGGGLSYTRNDTAWLYCFGGDADGSGGVSNVTSIYNVTTNTWSTGPVMTGTAVMYTSAARVGTTAYILGGIGLGGAFTSEINEIKRYNLATNTWLTNAANYPVTVADAKGSGYQDSLLYVCGGLTGGTSVATANVNLYSVSTNTWRAATPLPAPRSGGAMTIVGDTIVYVCGGTGYSSGLTNVVYRGVISQSDRSVITWTTGTNYPGTSQHRLDAAPWGCQGMIVGPGSANGFTTSNQVYRYSPGANVWTPMPNCPTVTSAAFVGSAARSGGIWRLIVASGLVLSPPYSIPQVQVLTDTLCPSSSAPTLVMYHDTTVFNQGRKDDRDTLFKYLPGVAGSYDRLPYNNTTVLPSLAGYSNIIIQETANDGATFLLSSAQRSAIIAWLNTGTPSAKKKLLMLGADLGYNYSRVGAPQIDVVFSEQTAGFVFKQDNASVSPFTIIGTNIDNNNTRTMTNTPTGGFGFWPDGNSTNNGSISLYRHQNHTANDTLAAIGRNTANYTVASAFQDPRYILNGGFGPMLAALWNYLSTPVGITPLNGTIPNVYSLSQNYPNPFNPVTNIKFALPVAGNVKIVVFDILGRQVATLVNEYKNAGNFVVDFDASNLSSGAYFYRLESGDFKETKKMLLVK